MSLTDLPDDAIYARQYRRCGKPSCTVCGPGRRGHGPYWYAYWREAGRRRSRYLGKQAPAGLAVDVAPGPPPVSTPPLPVQLPATLPPLRVRTLCGFAVWRGAEALPPACWRRRMVARLFKLLLSAPGQCLHRTQVIEALWPEVGAAEGATVARHGSPAAAHTRPAWGARRLPHGPRLLLALTGRDTGVGARS